MRQPSTVPLMDVFGRTRTSKTGPRPLISAILKLLALLLSGCSTIAPMTTDAQYNFKPSQALQVDGVSINFQASLRDNLDTVVVMVHGFGENLESWDDIYPALASEFSVVRLDLKGSGFSSKPAQETYSPVDQAKVLLGFIKSMGLRRVVLVGHSLGGAICLISYLQNLDAKSDLSIVGLVLVDAAVYAQRFPFFISALRNPITRFFSGLLPAESRVRLVLDYAMEVKSQITPKKVQSYSYFLKLPGAEFALAQTAKYIVPKNGANIAARFPEVKVPTLIIWGKDDKVIPLENGYRLHAAIAASEMIVLPETGHVPNEERPKEVIKLVKQFLAKVR